MNRLRKSPLALGKEAPHTKAEPVLIIRLARWNCGNAGVGNFFERGRRKLFHFRRCDSCHKYSFLTDSTQDIELSTKIHEGLKEKNFYGLLLAKFIIKASINIRMADLTFVSLRVLSGFFAPIISPADT